jgi:hypothetical protein
MTNDQPVDLHRQLEAAQQRIQQLEQERAELLQKVQEVEDKWANYKPLADAWLRHNMPSKEECEKELAEILAHPETWVDLKDVLKEIEEEFGEPKS